MKSNNKKQLGKIIAILAIGLSAGFSFVFLAQIGNAFSGGVSGFSGASGSSCSQCHSGGTPPTVTLSGPTVAFTGEVFTYTLTVAGGQSIAAGLGVSASDGVLTDTLAGSLYTQILGGELTHQNGDATQKASPSFPSYSHDGGPKCINDSCTQVPGGEVVFTFNWIAPGTAETVTLYGAGNSVNLDGANSGDSAATDTLTITVIDPATLTERLYLPLVVTD